MNVYSVGEFCQHEGGGWDRLVANNENTFNNIKKVLIEYHESRIKFLEDLSCGDDNDYLKKTINDDIDGHKYIIDLVKNAKSLDEVNGVEIPPDNHDVIRISVQEILF